MADKTPDATEGGDTTRTTGARRSGLDRLRAARGEEVFRTPTRDRQNEDAGESVGPGAGERSGGGSTALLESDRADSKRGTAPKGGTGRGTASGRGSAATAIGVGGRSAEGGRLGRLGRPGASTAVPRAGSPSRQQLVAAIVLGLLVVGLLIPVVLMRHRVVGQTKEQKAVTALIDKRVEAQSSALRFAATFFSPDYKTIDNYSNQVAAASTGNWLNDFNSKRGDLKSLLTQVQSQATAHVLAAGVSKVSGNDVEVLVVVDQDVKNTTSKGKTVTNRYRVQISMNKTPKGWLVTNLEPVV